MIDVVQLSKQVLIRLSGMDYEKDGGISTEQLIFPKKIQEMGAKHVNRISEQELRLLFIEELKNTYPELFYSIETPTVGKYSFGKAYETIITHKDGQSASHDLCIFKRSSNVYNRIFNIEFKHKNSVIKNIGKDILKLIQEMQNGAFIILLDNTYSDTLCNAKETGVFNKLYKSFSDFQAYWSNDDKSIELVILSLKQKTLVSRIIKKTDLNNLKDIFNMNNGFTNINKIKANGWATETIIQKIAQIKPAIPLTFRLAIATVDEYSGNFLGQHWELSKH